MNYHHLHIFWSVVKAKGVTRAGRKLGLTQSTLSTQLRQLEESLGVRLLEKQGRELVMTGHGRVAFQYAEEIFGLGEELSGVLRGHLGAGKLLVGISDGVPKTIAHRLLSPVFSLEQPPVLHCFEGTPEQLLADLAVHRLDMVLTDAMMPPQHPVRAYHHRLGDCGVRFMAAPRLAEHLSAFPICLDAAPFLMPGPQAAVRRELEDWFAEVGVKPRVVAEFEDAALMKIFGQAGRGIFPVPAATAEEVRKSYGVVDLGGTEKVRERFFAITVERRVRMPALLAILQGTDILLSKM